MEVFFNNLTRCTAWLGLRIGAAIRLLSGFTVSQPGQMKLSLPLLLAHGKRSLVEGGVLVIFAGCASCQIDNNRGIFSMLKIKRRKAEVPQELQGSALHPVLQRVYAARGIKSPADLSLRLAELVHPDRMPDIDVAAGRIVEAVKNNEKIVIVGDFDADGATATAVMIRFLRDCKHHNVDFLVPNRFDFGYGLTPPLIPIIKDMGGELIITVDNGISSHDGVKAANEFGMEVIITDHHLPGDELPPALAVVNPNNHHSDFPSGNLSGVGVAWYLAARVRAKLIESGHFNDFKPPAMTGYLDLVALGTVADVVPLDKNNRVLIESGINRVRSGQCCTGIKTLLEVAGRPPEKCEAQDFAFYAAPRLNAAGRLEDMSVGIELLLTNSADIAQELAMQLDEINSRRKEIQHEMQQLADSVIRVLKKHDRVPAGIVLHHKDWHQGVVGLLASKVKESTGRPVFAFAKESDGMLKGSGRSVKGFHMRDALVAIDASHPGLITKFGGHAMAAGLTLPEENLSKFTSAFEMLVKAQGPLDDAIETDGPLDEMDITLDLAGAIASGGPWGQGFPAPIFDNVFDIVEKREIGQGHTRLRLRLPDGFHIYNAVAFGRLPVEFPPEGGRVMVAYELNVNEWRDRKTAQIMVRHFSALKPNE